MKKTGSPYSKMYLVSPGVYEKLKNCITEKDKMVVDGLNVEEKEEQSPSDKVVEEITQKDFDEQIVKPFEPVEQEVIPTNPTDVIYSNPNVVEEQKVIIPKEVEYSNPLTAPCSDVYPKEQLVPTIYQPTVSDMINVIPNPAVVMRKPDHINPNVMLERLPPPINMNPNVVLGKKDIVNPTVVLNKLAVPANIVQKHLGKAKPISFQCPICFKLFTRKADVNRHINTIHTVNPNSRKSVSTPQVLDDGDEIMKESKKFDDWSTVVRRGLRSGKSFAMDTSKPTLRGKRTALKARLGNINIPSKARPPGGEESEATETFQHWD